MMRLQQSRRQTWGNVYKPQVDNNIANVQYTRNVYDEMENQYIQPIDDNHMSGEGIRDIARGLYGRVKRAGQYVYDKRGVIKDMGEKAVQFYGSDFGKAIQNVLPSGDETARDGFSGERHAILQLSNGKYGVANYMGPGTRVIERLKRGDPPRTLADKVAQRHDIDYALAAGMKDKDAQNKAIRAADKRMVASLDKIGREGTDAQKNVFQGKRLIQGKMAAEDIGLMAKGSFGGDLAPISDKDRILLMANQKQLAQQGYGLPAQMLKMKLVKSMRKKGKKGKGLRPAGGGLSLAGRGLSLAGRGKKKRKKGKKMKGGFFWFLPAAVAGIASAIAGTVATGVATGAASALGSHITKKIIGDGMKMKGRGVGDVAKKVAQVIGKNKDTIVKVAQATKVLPSELPKEVIEKADTALRAIQEVAGGKPPKEKLLGVVKMLIPHVRKVFDEKLKAKVGMAGQGVLAGIQVGRGMNEKILKIVSKEI